MSPRRRMMCLCIAGSLLAVGRPTAGDWHEPFESATPTWRLAESDCAARLLQHERTFRVSHTGLSCEFARLAAGAGTFAHLSFAIPPARVISELSLHLWVKSDRPGIQLLARVVLPRTRDERTGKPLTTFIRGTAYDRAGRWQSLSITSPHQLVSQQAIVLNSQLRSSVDPREAFVDLIVLNAYGGQGQTQLWIDDLELVGHVAAATTVADGPSTEPQVRPASYSRPTSPSHPVADWQSPDAVAPQMQGATLLVNRRPFVPSIVRHQGEPLESLATLGFNTVQLAEAPTAQQHAEAERLQLWFLAPPPPDGAAPAAAGRVVAWQLGEQLDTTSLPEIVRRAAAARTFDAASRRPLFCGAVSDDAALSRQVDILRLDAPRDFWSIDLSPNAFPSNTLAPGDSRPALARIWRTRAAQARPGVPIWVSIPLDAPTPATEGTPATGRHGSSAARMAVYQAIAAGARGFSFAPPQPLDHRVASAQRLLADLRGVLKELRLIGPWLAAAGAVEELSTGDVAWQAHVLATERSRLIVAQHQPGVKIGARLKTPTHRGPLTLIDAGARTSAEAFQITPQGLRQLRRQRIAGGVQIEAHADDDVVLVVMTEDRSVLQWLQRELSGNRP